MDPATPKPTGGKRRRLLCCGVLLLLTGLGVWIWRWASAPTPPVFPVLEDAELVQALHQASDDVRRQPRSGSAWGKLGMVCQANKLDEEALSCYRVAEQWDAREFRWPYLQAFLLHRTDDEAALEKLRRAAALAPEQLLVRVQLGEMLLAQGSASEAAVEFAAVLAMDAGNAYGKLGLARVAARQLQWLECQTQAWPLRFLPQVSRTAHLLLAEVLHRNGQREEAQAMLEQAQRLPPDPERADPVVNQMAGFMAGMRARLFRADRLTKMGNVDAAIQLLQEGVKVQPSQDVAWLALGKTFALRANQQIDEGARRGDYAAAVAALQRAAASAPAKAQPQFFLGLAYWEQAAARPDNLGQATEHLQRAVALDPGHYLALLYLGKCLGQQRQFPEAVRVLRQAHRLRPDDPDVHVPLGEHLLHMGQVQEAWWHGYQAVRLKGGDEETLGLFLMCQWRLLRGL